VDEPSRRPESHPLPHHPSFGKGNEPMKRLLATTCVFLFSSAAMAQPIAFDSFESGTLVWRVGMARPELAIQRYRQHPGSHQDGAPVYDGSYHVRITTTTPTSGVRRTSQANSTWSCSWPTNPRRRAITVASGSTTEPPASCSIPSRRTATTTLSRSRSSLASTRTGSSSSSATRAEQAGAAVLRRPPDQALRAARSGRGDLVEPAQRRDDPGRRHHARLVSRQSRGQLPPHPG